MTFAVRLRPEGGWGLPCVCTSRAIDLSCVFNGYGPGDFACTSVGWGIESPDSTLGQLALRAFEVWLRANMTLHGKDVFLTLHKFFVGLTGLKWWAA